MKESILFSQESSVKIGSCVNEDNNRNAHTYKDFVQTIATGNGKELAGHQEIAEALDAELYFAHPHSFGARCKRKR
ncbi:hypothetical protein FMH16_04195 [Vibrio vulnificus]|nr:hypothetical protein [Vibrio vulnificus]